MKRGTQLAALALVTLALFLAAGCGDDTLTGEQTVGKSCKTNADCGTLSAGYCASLGVCTRQCTAHVDCGCANGTTNPDIAAGKCRAACMSGGTSGNFCMRACQTNKDCEIGTCQQAGTFKVCS